MVKRFLWVIFFAVVLFILIYGNIKFERQKSLKYYDIEVVVGQINNVELGKDRITFYSSPGRRISGSISLTDEKNKKVEVFKEGEIADWLELSQDKFKIKAGETYDFPVTLIIPNKVELGNYSMKLRVELT